MNLRKRRRKATGCLWFALACALSNACIANMAEEDDPVSGSWLIEFNSIFPVAESGEAKHIRNTWLKSDFGFTGKLTDRLEFFSMLVLEPVFMDQGRDQLFDNEGLFLEEVGIALALESAHVFLGKFNPVFGLAWDDSLGLFADDLADEYEVTEQVGAAVEMTGQFGQTRHQLYVGAFTDDRSIFSDSAFTSRGRNRAVVKSGSGLRQLKSVVLALSGKLHGVSDGLGYHLSYRKLAMPGGAGPDNRGVVAALQYENTIFGDTRSRVLVEWAEFDHFYQAHDQVRFITPSITLQKERFELGFSWAKKAVVNGGVDSRWLWQAHVSYALKEHAHISVGWKRESDARGDFHQIGLRLQSTFEF